MNPIDTLPTTNALMASQWADGRRPDGRFIEERNLWCAAFELAKDDWLRAKAGVRPAGMNNLASGTLARARRLQAELNQWLESAERCPKSFLWYCEVLGLDAGATRARWASDSMLLTPRRGDLNTKIRPRAT